MTTTPPASDTDGGAPSWQEPLRGLFETAREELDRMQILLYRQCQDAHDVKVGKFKGRFDKVYDLLVDLAINELYPPENHELDEAGERELGRSAARYTCIQTHRPSRQ